MNKGMLRLFELLIERCKVKRGQGEARKKGRIIQENKLLRPAKSAATSKGLWTVF